MNIEIKQSEPADLATIFQFYEYAVAHQKKVSNMYWKGFEEAVIVKEIEEDRQYQLWVDGTVACVFMVSFKDVQIWEDRGNDPAIYIHRIATHPDYREMAFVKYITAWAIRYAQQNSLNFVRLDTWADNKKLNEYYPKFGFQPAGNKLIGSDSGLPKHYEGIRLSLFEIRV